MRFSSVQSLSHVWLFATPWAVVRQTSLSITNSWSAPKPMSIESVMPSNHLTLGRRLLVLPSIFPSIRVFSNESALHIRWPKYWSFSFNISPSSEHPGLISVYDELVGSPCSPRDSQESSLWGSFVNIPIIFLWVFINDYMILHIQFCFFFVKKKLIPFYNNLLILLQAYLKDISGSVPDDNKVTITVKQVAWIFFVL